tara:strand:- start:56 stop:691 length:636 start_codon:yes stop_codon:yes gene_type:complete
MSVEIDGVNNVIKPDGSAMTIGASGDTITIPSGATITATAATTTGFYAFAPKIDRWRLTTSLSTSDTEPVSANLERIDDYGSDSGVAGNALINAGMTVSSGVWTFPATGKYHVEFIANTSSTSDERYVGLFIQETINGGTNWYSASTSYSSIEDAHSSGTWMTIYTDAYIDVTNTSNVKVRFNVNAETTTTFVGDSGRDYTAMTFTKVGDT